MIINLDMQSELPIYSQLVYQIIEGVASGELQLGEALPSVRNLAADIGVNLHTVNKAYTLLKNDGYIQIHRQKGVVVNPEGMPPITDNFLNKQRQELRPIIAEALCRGMSEEELSTVLSDIYAEIKSGNNKA
jgi:DNA-binding transcriptional regulator YhcF (GntR family)